MFRLIYLLYTCCVYLLTAFPCQSGVFRRATERHLFSISAKLVDFLHTLYGLREEIHVFIDVAS